MIRLEDIDLFMENDDEEEAGFGDRMKKIGKDVSKSAIDYAGRDVDDGGLGIDINAIKNDWEGKNKGGRGKDVTPGFLGKSKIAADVAKTVSGQMDRKFNDFKSNNEVNGRSIIARSRNSIKQFPIYVTQTIRVNEAHLISKLFEKVYTSFFQTVISQNPIITPEEANDLGFLKKFHTDVMESAKILINEFYEPIDDFDAMMKESIYYECQLSDTCKVEFSVIPSNLERDLIMENARLMNEPLTGLPYIYYEDGPYKSKEKKKVEPKEKGMVLDHVNRNKDEEIVRLKEDDLVDMAKVRLSRVELNLLNMSNSSIENTIESEYPLPSRPDEGADSAAVSAYNHEVYTVRKERNKMRQDLYNQRKDAIENLEDEIKLVKDDIKDGKFNNGKNGYIYYDKDSGMYLRRKIVNREVNQYSAPNQTQTPELLRQSDIKKINGMDPYMMKATFIIRDTVANTNTEVSYIIGIKSVMHLIYAQDLADELYELVTGNIKSLQKVRYKTGEINFMDYMFNIKGLKSDASKNINYNKRWISTLKKLADFNKTHGSLLKKPINFIKGGDAVIPNATLVLSQSDVISLVNKTGIDLSQISNAKKLAKNLFLIAIAIVDPSSGSMKVFYPDRDSDWDVQSLASIDAEVSKTDNSNLMKELQKAINK